MNNSLLLLDCLYSTTVKILSVFLILLLVGFRLVNFLFGLKVYKHFRNISPLLFDLIVNGRFLFKYFFVVFLNYRSWASLYFVPFISFLDSFVAFDLRFFVRFAAMLALEIEYCSLEGNCACITDDNFFAFFGQDRRLSQPSITHPEHSALNIIIKCVSIIYCMHWLLVDHL